MRRLLGGVLLLLLAGCDGSNLGPDDLHFTAADVPASPELVVPSLQVTAGPGSVHLEGLLAANRCSSRVEVTGQRDAHALTLTIITRVRPDAVCPADIRYLGYEAALDEIAPGPFTVRVYWTRQLSEPPVLAGTADVTIPS
jgi:hypothetical protein